MEERDDFLAYLTLLVPLLAVIVLDTLWQNLTERMDRSSMSTTISASPSSEHPPALLNFHRFAPSSANGLASPRYHDVQTAGTRLEKIEEPGVLIVGFELKAMSVEHQYVGTSDSLRSHPSSSPFL